MFVNVFAYLAGMFVFSLRTYVHIADFSLPCSSMHSNVHLCIYVCMYACQPGGALVPAMKLTTGLFLSP